MGGAFFCSLTSERASKPSMIKTENLLTSPPGRLLLYRLLSATFAFSQESPDHRPGLA
jgi:hypothetical protein